MSKLNIMKSWQGIIVASPHIMMGKPIIKGTRVTVELVMEKLSEGMPVAELLQAYPHITAEQVQACLGFALDNMKFDVEYSLVS